MKKAIRYSIIVCLFSWAMFAVVHRGFGIGADTPTGLMAFSTVYMFFPLITALVLQAIDKEKFNHTGLVNFKVSWTWVVAWLLPVVLVFLCILINGLMPGVSLEYNSEQLINQYHVPENQQEMVREQMGQMPAYLMMIITLVSGLAAGVTVNAIAPGFFSTAQNAKLLWNDDGTPTARTGKILAATPMGRFGESKELSGALLFLLNNEAAGFITGVTIPIDGGFSAYSGV